MNYQKIKSEGCCCISGRPLAASKKILVVQTKYLATWPYPVFKPDNSGCLPKAIAFVDAELYTTSYIRSVVELKNGTFIYHPIATLKFVDDNVITEEQLKQVVGINRPFTLFEKLIPALGLLALAALAYLSRLFQ